MSQQANKDRFPSHHRRAHGRAVEDSPLQCPNCTQWMTLQSVKGELAKPSATVSECKLSISETIEDDPDRRTLQ